MTAPNIPSHSRPTDGRADATLGALVRRQPTVLVFLPNTNELQRFVWSGAFDELAKEHQLHYVLPSADAEKMRAAADVFHAQNTSTLTVSPERFAVWQEVFKTATINYGDLSPSFAIRAGIPMRTGRLKAMTPEERQAYDAEYDAKVEALVDGLEPLPEILDLFKRLDPLFCIVPTSLLDTFCNDVVWACEAESIACVVLQSGWDNISSKGILFRRTPYLGCWGPQSGDHAKKIQRLSRALTKDLGAPHYEFLKRASEADVRVLRTELGIDPEERMLLFGGSFRQFDETSFLQRLEAIIESGRFGSTRVVYRPHPWRAARKHEEDFFEQRWNHIVFDPDMSDRYKRERIEGGYIKRNVPMFDMVYLSQLISAADAVISPMSTLLLEALILEKPTMAVAFGDGKHAHDPSVTSQMTHFGEVLTSNAIVCARDPDRLEKDLKYLLGDVREEKRAAARQKILPFVVTREPGTYAERLATFCHDAVEPAARKLRSMKTSAERGTISHAYGAHRIAAEYCRLSANTRDVPGYWMHGWIPAFHSIHPALIALHKKEGQHSGYDFEAQIREERERTQQWVSREDQAEYLIRHGYQHVKAIGLPIVYLQETDVPRIPGSLLVMPPHSHKNHGPGDPIAEQYAEMIAGLRSRFSEIWVGLNEDDIAKKQWVGAFRHYGIPTFTTTDQSDPNTLVRLRRLLSSFEFVTTNGYGSHIALAAYCGARVSIYGPFAEFPYERMKVTHAVKMFPELLEPAHQLCTEEALRTHYEFLFADPDKAEVHQDWGAREVGEPSRQSPDQLARRCGLQQSP